MDDRGRDDRLAGKVVAVTGAASGLGAAIALHCARHGARIAVCDIASEQGAQVAVEIAKAGGKACYFDLDVTDEALGRKRYRASGTSLVRCTCL